MGQTCSVEAPNKLWDQPPPNKYCLVMSETKRCCSTSSTMLTLSFALPYILIGIFILIIVSVLMSVFVRRVKKSLKSEANEENVVVGQEPAVFVPQSTASSYNTGNYNAPASEPTQNYAYNSEPAVAEQYQTPEQIQPGYPGAQTYPTQDVMQQNAPQPVNVLF